jgi:hypothetical protein
MTWSVIFQSIILCELVFVSAAAIRLVGCRSIAPIVRKIQHVVMLNLVLVLTLVVLTALHYWETKVVWPFMYLAVVLVLSDFAMTSLNTHILSYYVCSKN